jgi:C1A family cysteine protease
MEVFKRKLGCNKDPKDKRDYKFMMRHRATELPEAVEFPERINWLYDQGNEGSCVGHGMVSAFRNALLLNGQTDVEFSRQMAYYIARRPYQKNQDAGACIRDAIKAAKRYGICPESMWPYVYNNIFTRPLDECYVEAEKHQLLIGERVKKDINAIKSAIAAGFGVVFGINVYESFFKVGKSGIVSIPDTKHEQYEGGHCMFMVGYSGGYFDVLNSWGRDWGNDGKCRIPENYMLEQANDLWAVHLTE